MAKIVNLLEILVRILIINHSSLREDLYLCWGQNIEG